jgi:hypothetical protein
MGKLRDSKPESPIGGIGIDTRKNQLRIEVVEGGCVRRVVWIGSSDASGGEDREGYGACRSHCQKDD